MTSNEPQKQNDEKKVVRVSRETVQLFEELHPKFVGLCDLYVKHGYLEIVESSLTS